MRKAILIVLAVVVLIGIIFLLNANKDDDQVGGDQQPTTSIDASDWKTYRNEELGFELKYPGEWGELNFTINSGETGKAFSGYFPSGFAKFDLYTTDWSRPIGIGSVFRSYTSNSDGNYNYYYSEDKFVSFNATKAISLPDGGEILIVKGKNAVDLYSNLTGQSIEEAGPSEFIHLIDRSVIYAFTNFAENFDGSLIKGFAFVGFGGPNYDEISELEARIFELFVSSFRNI